MKLPPLLTSMVVVLLAPRLCEAGVFSWLLDKFLNWQMPYSPEVQGTIKETDMTVADLIRFNGYEAEQYDVLTPDGYLLTLQRIPRAKNGTRPTARHPVLILHGLICRSAVWVDNHDDSLGFILADAGFDVWLGNFRGTKDGLKHVNLSADYDPEFWNFRIDHLAKYDLPSMIDFIRNATGVSRILLVGHSMGTTASFATFASKPEYNDRVQGFAALAPVVTIGYLTTLIRPLAYYSKQVKAALSFIHVHNLFRQTQSVHNVLVHACGSDKLSGLCALLHHSAAGYNPFLHDKKMTAVYFSHCPSGISVDTIYQYGQMVNSKNFSFFDHYDEEENMKQYGQVDPPTYNVSLVSVPTAVFWGTNDALADPLDIALLLRQLRSLVLTYRVPHPFFSHYDFMWTTNMRELFADRLVETLYSMSNDNKTIAKKE